MLAVDELRYVFHRSGTVKCVHGYEVLESGGLQLFQVFLHSCRLELERAYRPAFAVESVGGGVLHGYVVYVNDCSSACLYVFQSFFDDRQCLQAEKIHLDESGRFYDAAFILRYEYLLARVFVFGRAHGHPVGYVIPAYYGAAGMYSCVSDVAFEHFRIFNGVAQFRVGRCFGGLQFRYVGYGRFEVHFLHIRYLVGDELGQSVRFGQRQFFHPCHVFQSHLGCHCAIGDDVGHFFAAVFLCHPAQDLAASVVIEVDVYIGQ